MGWFKKITKSVSKAIGVSSQIKSVAKALGVKEEDITKYATGNFINAKKGPDALTFDNLLDVDRIIANNGANFSAMFEQVNKAQTDNLINGLVSWNVLRPLKEPPVAAFDGSSGPEITQETRRQRIKRQGLGGAGASLLTDGTENSLSGSSLLGR